MNFDRIDGMNGMLNIPENTRFKKEFHCKSCYSEIRPINLTTCNGIGIIAYGICSNCDTKTFFEVKDLVEPDVESIIEPSIKICPRATCFGKLHKVENEGWFCSFCFCRYKLDD